MGASVAPKATEEYDVAKSPQPLASPKVVDLVDAPKHPRRAIAERRHLEHKRQTVQTSILIQSFLDLLEGPYLDAIADEGPPPTGQTS